MKMQMKIKVEVGRWMMDDGILKKEGWRSQVT
jgi:hypothetical protein